MDRIFIVGVAIAMLAIWLLFYLLPFPDYPYSPEHLQAGYRAALRYFGFPH
jgi:hypothetical protein